MNVDCLRQVLLYCNVNDVLTFNSANKDFNKIINDDNFWKLLMLRDFEDINKLVNEKWLDYYKRRNINYGIPILINIDIYQYNQVKQFISFIDNKQLQNLILTKNNDLYIINNSGFVKINHHVKIKKIYDGCKEFYFVDINDCLYKIISTKSLKLLKINVDKVVIDHCSDIYYTDNTNSNLTYYINNNVSQRILDYKILDLLNLGGIDYIINEENILLIGKTVNKKYEMRIYKLKAIQLSRINNKIVLILGIDGFVIICRDNKFRRIKIPNVKMLGFNSFLTKNGDLYYFNKTYKEILIDTNVVDVSYITDDGEDGCYVKRNFI